MLMKFAEFTSAIQSWRWKIISFNISFQPIHMQEELDYSYQPRILFLVLNFLYPSTIERKPYMRKIGISHMLRKWKLVRYHQSVKKNLKIWCFKRFVWFTWWWLLRIETRINVCIWIITNTMHRLSSVYRVITPLHVSGVSAAHHQEVECIHVTNGTCYTSEVTVSGPAARWQSPQKYNKYNLSHVYILPPDDGLLIRSKYVEVW
jgi:hypothetical protein